MPKRPRLRQNYKAYQNRYKMAEKAELVITALQQRIGELVAGYETQIAILRADLTQLMDDKDAKEKAAEEYSASLNSFTN